MRKNTKIEISEYHDYEDPTTVRNASELIEKIEAGEAAIRNGESTIIDGEAIGDFLDEIMDEVLAEKKISN